MSNQHFLSLLSEKGFISSKCTIFLNKMLCSFPYHYINKFMLATLLWKLHNSRRWDGNGIQSSPLYISLRKAAMAITITIYFEAKKHFGKSGYSFTIYFFKKKLIWYSVKLIFNIILYFIRQKCHHVTLRHHTNLSGNVICFLSF